MPDRGRVIEGLRWALDNVVDPFVDFRFAGYDGSIVMLNAPIIKDAIDLLEALDVTPEELERMKKCRHECKIDCLLEHYEKIKAERDALLKDQETQWTPITFRPLTEEEKAEHPEWCYIIESPTPEDGEDILVSNGRAVWADVWGNNGVECYLESDHELEGVAWMKMPTPWKKEENT